MSRVGRLLLAGLVVAAAGCVTARNYLDPDQPLYEGAFARPPASAAAAPESIHVVTFNIEKGEHVKRAVELLRSRPELAGADVLLLQEMQPPGVEETAHALGLNYVYYPASHHTKQERDIGNAILTPWPIVERWKIVLPHLSRFSHHARSVVGARLRIGDRHLRVYSLHLGTPINLSTGQRHEQLQAVAEDASGSPDPVLVGGDFNSKGMAEWLAEKGYDWPTEDVGKTTTLLSFSFDHVLVRGLRPVADPGAGVVRDVPGISDHFPVWVRLAWPEAPQPRAHPPATP